MRNLLQPSNKVHLRARTCIVLIKLRFLKAEWLKRIKIRLQEDNLFSLLKMVMLFWVRRVCWLVLLLTLYKFESSEREPQLRKCLQKTVSKLACKAFSQCLVWEGTDRHGRCYPWVGGFEFYGLTEPELTSVVSTSSLQAVSQSVPHIPALTAFNGEVKTK